MDIRILRLLLLRYSALMPLAALLLSAGSGRPSPIPCPFRLKARFSQLGSVRTLSGEEFIERFPSNGHVLFDLLSILALEGF